jgi:hypothetical protein
LPTACDSGRIEWCHIKLNPRGGEIDAHPVDEPAALLGYREPLTTIRNACENLDWLVRATLLPKIPVEESAEDEKRREPAYPFLATFGDHRATE